MKKMSSKDLETISVRKAISIGLLWVNGPIFPLILGIPALVFILTVNLKLPSSFIWIGILAGFVLAWLWWSSSVPKWRLWALQRVDNISQLYMKAVRSGLIWPRGHFFEKTEIRSNSHAIK